MRILFIANYYPPSRYGWGYMQLCEEVADGLAARGHEIAVLTSTQRDGPEIARPYPVHRLLTIEPDWHSPRPAAWQFFVGRRSRERRAVAHLQRLVADFRPQVIFVWHAIGLPRLLLQAAEQTPGVVTAYYLAGYLPELPDEYMAYWQAEPVRWSARLFKRPLARLALATLRREGKPIRLRYEHVICVSNYVRRRLVDQGLIPKSAVVIHNGVDLSVFAPTIRPSWETSGIVSCLVAGRVVPEKGLHTVIEAFAQLPEHLKRRCRLTILGDGPAAYVAALHSRVLETGLTDVVSFQAPIPRSAMPDVLRQHHILLLPSEYAEPIARSMQEA
ncbi:MAG: glycosyltransferase family 4 protein, partial [Anaerolineae bacterium]|nr:glycosyltransferase family 4 protein [Anaerolineae bacterium]